MCSHNISLCSFDTHDREYWGEPHNTVLEITVGHQALAPQILNIAQLILWYSQHGCH